VAPTQPAQEAWLVVGRRGGKSRVAALIAVYLACFRNYGQILAPGEVGTLPIVAADRRQARAVMGYVKGLIEQVPMLGQLVVHEMAESVEFSTRCRIEIHTASWRSLRGYTCVGAVLDEVAFWRSDESANPDVEIVNALRPAMATVIGALLVAISSPYARRGILWEQYRRHYAREDDPVLVWQAGTRAMNPHIDERIIATAMEQDEAAAAAEYGAEFRRDVESFLTREAIEAVVIPGRRELPPLADVSYLAFVDPSGGAGDSMTLAIAHHDDGRGVLDAIRERRPPFSPQAVVAEFAALLDQYRVVTVAGDRYAGEWPREAFRAHGIDYEPAELAKSDLYRTLLAHVNSRRVELLDHPRLFAQLGNLERRTAWGGRDSIDHGPGGHDDVANAVAGALVAAAEAVCVGIPHLGETRRAWVNEWAQQSAAGRGLGPVRSGRAVTVPPVPVRPPPTSEVEAPLRLRAVRICQGIGQPDRIQLSARPNRATFLLTAAAPVRFVDRFGHDEDLKSEASERSRIGR
jgi:hypothetical protein